MTSSTGLCRGHSRLYGFMTSQNVDDVIDGRVVGGYRWVVLGIMTSWFVDDVIDG